MRTAKGMLFYWVKVNTTYDDRCRLTCGVSRSIVDEKSPRGGGNTRTMTIVISIINKPHLLFFFPMLEMTFVRQESVLLLADDASLCQFQLTARLSGVARFYLSTRWT